MKSPSSTSVRVAQARSLCLDAIEAAGSGHPGIALSMTPVLHLLFQEILRHNPSNPNWLGRDKFVLSCGHASIALYVQLLQSGYDIDIEDIRDFRKLGSITPGHPEWKVTPGVEASTGPLGQGFAMAVGLAIENLHLENIVSRKFGNESFDLGRIFVLASDGDLQEGITQEAASIAGEMKLKNLCVIYDDNNVTIDGRIDPSIKEDTKSRFEAMGWDVETIQHNQGEDIDIERLRKAILKNGSTSPRLLILESEIAYPSPTYTGKHFSHGNLLGAQEVSAIKDLLNTSHLPIFEISDEFGRQIILSRENGLACESNWNAKHETQILYLKSKLAQGFRNSFSMEPNIRKISTRKVNGSILAKLKADSIIWIGGSGDLTESNGLENRNFIFTEIDPGVESNTNIKFGIREHAMSAICNGLALSGLLNPYCATYLVFSDYQRPAIRMASLMQTNVLFIWTHDSISVGPDGPTHQPVEHLSSLRALPGFDVIRPADATELLFCWEKILIGSGPKGLVLSRQDLPVLSTELLDSSGVQRGAYVLANSYVPTTPNLILVATGAEIHAALQIHQELNSEDFGVRVVSMPCMEWFRQASVEYREQIVPTKHRKKVVIEAGVSFGWHEFIGPEGLYININEFGKSGSPDAVNAHFGFDLKTIRNTILEYSRQTA
jgi:transketolase